MHTYNLLHTLATFPYPACHSLAPQGLGAML
jgi:hypothetical protein